ncbi:MAG: sigma-70 family RNA polymerase sigma factor [Phycisphaerales bacterium]|jgi:RNA polymerase sigma factor (TIGR02999 family)|nr:sigma-70 family RNA polymerase sigma factor [Planctomycetota bacterium]MBL6997095.1 sigma-70 family RNA polymerase sigma factor [Phycisphaerales bacterium]
MTPQPLNELMPEVYDELRRLAEASMRHERAGHTLQATALVNEIYLRLGHQEEAKWQSRAHFFAAAAQAIRRILIDHARKKYADKRGGNRSRVPLENAVGICDSTEVEILDLDSALLELEEIDARAANVVALRFFGGLNMEEISTVIGVSKRTVEGDWTTAKAWLRGRLE